MELVVALALGAALFLAVELFWFPRSSRAATLGASRDEVGGPEPTVEFGLFSAAFVRDRLDALARELDQLDQDPDVFAKAFHILAARAAYQALLADASRLSQQPSRPTGPILDVELVGSSVGTREVLEL